MMKVSLVVDDETVFELNAEFKIKTEKKAEKSGKNPDSSGRVDPVTDFVKRLSDKIDKIYDGFLDYVI